MQIEELDAGGLARNIDGFAALLHACVHGGGNVGFILPFSLGRGLISAGPKTGSGHQDGCQIVACELVEACGDPSEVFQFVEEALDEIALAVDLAVDDTTNPDVALRGNVSRSAAGLDELDDRAGEETTVGNHMAGQGKAFDQLRKGSLVGRLARRENQAHRQTLVIHNGMDLGAQSSTRTADGVIRTPFLPPAACWWARTIELSIRCKDLGERRASVSNTFSHTPALAQRLNRL